MLSKNIVTSACIYSKTTSQDTGDAYKGVHKLYILKVAIKAKNGNHEDKDALSPATYQALLLPSSVKSEAVKSIMTSEKLGMGRTNDLLDLKENPHF